MQEPLRLVIRADTNAMDILTKVRGICKVTRHSAEHSWLHRNKQLVLSQEKEAIMTTKKKKEKKEKKLKKVEEGAAEKPKMVPPDGGWGWMILIAYGLGCLFMIPIVQNFGLIYKDRLRDLNFTSTDITTLATINSWFGMILGIFNAPLLKKYGYRKMSFAGVFMFTAGTFMTAFANSYAQFIISYGVLSSLGLTYTMSSFSLAMNSYFKKKRSFAASRVMTITGLGPIFMPLLISEMLNGYGIKWTALLLAATNMHGFIGVALLQPVKWHMKKEEVEEEKEQVEEDATEEAQDLLADVQSIFGVEAIVSDRSRQGSRRPSAVSRQNSYQRTASTEKFSSMNSINRIRSTALQDVLSSRLPCTMDEGYASRLEKRASVGLLDNEDYSDMLGSTLLIMQKYDGKDSSAALASQESLNSDRPDIQRNLSETDTFLTARDDAEDDEAEEVEPRPWWRRLGSYICTTYDLDLLLDPIYLNLTVGMSIAIIGELTFSVLTPFILTDMGMTTEEIALFVAVIAIADLIFRFLAPYFGKYCKYGSRVMYIIALFLLLITRLGLFLANDYKQSLAVALGLGIGKGFRTVYWVLVIPDYVPLEKLASASAFQNLCTGVFLIAAGPLLGLVVEINNKYSNLIYASNAMTATTIFLWTLEYVIRTVAKRRRKQSALPTAT